MGQSAINLPSTAAELEQQAYASFIRNLKTLNPKELVLVNPQLVPEDVFDPVVARHRGYYAFPPIGLLYLAAVAKSVRPDLVIKIIDLNYELLRLAHEENFSYQAWKPLMDDVLRTCAAPYIGVTCMFGATKPLFLDVCHWLREHYPDAPIMAGGVQATYDGIELLNDNVCDILFRRESENQFKALLESVSGKGISMPWGAVYRSEGQIHELAAPEEEPPVNWDIRPFYNLINIQDYYKYGSLAAFSRYNGADKAFATVLSNRGCRARCTFCTVRNFNGFGVRGRTVQDVIDEIKFLVNVKGIKQIDWLDDDLLFDPKRTLELLKGLAAQVPNLEWISNNGLIAAAISEEIMEWMVKSGLKAFKIGIESGNDEMLHKIKKPTTKQKLRDARKLFWRYPDVFVSANFIIGFPHETVEQMLDTFNFANELKWDWSSMYICQPLKGTEMFSAFQELGDERTEFENYDKTLNPGRAAAKGEIESHFGDDLKSIATGRDVFQLPKGLVPSQAQIRELWFTFNLVANFIENPNFKKGGNPEKMVRWFESIAHAYPFDASMSAGTARAYKLLGNREKFKWHRNNFISLLSDSGYWQRRVREFPELLDFSEVSSKDIARGNTVKTV